MTMTATKHASAVALLLVVAIAPGWAQSIVTINDKFEADRLKIEEEISRVTQDLNTAKDLSARKRLEAEVRGYQKRWNKLVDDHNAQLEQAYNTLRKRAAGLNADADRVNLEGAIVGSQADVLKKVAEFRTKGDFEKNRPKFREEWEQNYGIRLKVFGPEFDELKKEVIRNMKEKYGLEMYGARIGTSNPYTGDAYYKFYDDKGQLRYAIFNQDAEGLRKWQQDLQTYWRRRRDEGLEYDKTIGSFNRVRTDTAKQAKKIGSDLTGLAKRAEALRREAEDPVAGRRASGKLHIRNFYVKFGKDGTLSAYTTRNTTEKPYTGRYKITGDRIEFELGPSKFVGTIKGNRITGNRTRSDGVKDTWDLTLE